MIEKIYICYLFSYNRGSEWQLGENILSRLTTNQYILCAAHQLKHNNSGIIGKIPYLRVDGKIKVIGLPSRKNEPIHPSGFRVDYLFWTLRCYNKLKKRIKKTTVQHVNFAQILTPIPRSVRKSKNFYFGPVGGQGAWYKSHHLPLLNRLLNFIIFEVLYTIFARMKYRNLCVVHPILLTKFKTASVEPAIKLKNNTLQNYIGDKKNGKRLSIIHVSRRVYFKLPQLHERLFRDLADLNPDKDFRVVGKGWGEIFSKNENLIFEESIPRDEIFELFDRSHYHINLSLELAGFVNLEASFSKCITIGAVSSGAEFLLSPSGEYLIDVYNSSLPYGVMLEKINELIQRFDSGEAIRQSESAAKHAI